MKTYYKKAAAVIVAIALLLSTSTISMGQFQTPANIRVGLYYKDASVNTALSIFSVSAAAGLQAGFFINDTFTEIYREPSSSTLYARKDTYYYNSGDSLKEYNPASTTAEALASFAKFGPYHIKIGGDCPDQATAAAQVATYRQAGVQAYIAYNDMWQVWVGSYPDEAAAQADAAVFMPLLGGVGFVVVPPAPNRIMLVNAQYQPVCVFGSNAAYFQLRPAPENNPPVIIIKGKPYRGALEVRRLAASDMTVINYITMQEYLYGSVPNEIGGRSPAEAIKAQAIAAKMYAINSRGKHAKAGFDVCPTTDCQVYKGFSSEVQQCNQAIDTVKDLVITYDGKLAGSIYYFASSGGRTEDVRNVWGSAVPYLISVEDQYEKIYTWTKMLRASDIKAKLPQLGNILGVSITQTAESGRVTQLAVRGDSRIDPALYLRERCRTLFSLDSQLYTITTDADVYTSSLSHIPASVALVSAAPQTSSVPVLTAPPALASSGDVFLPATTPLATSETVSDADDSDRALARAIAQSLSGNSSQMQPPDSSVVSGNHSAITNTAGSTGSVDSTGSIALTGSTSSADSTGSIASTSSADSTGPTGNSSSVNSAGGLLQPLSTNIDNPAVVLNNSQTSGQTTPDQITSNQTIPGQSTSAQTPAAISSQSAMKILIPVPVAANPVKTQLGGMKVVTANGVTALGSSNNKITILGAEGAIRTATLVPETYTFTGKGWGHAVGLSQEGAIGMGRAGIPFDQILTHYFQGTRIDQG